MKREGRATSARAVAPPAWVGAGGRGVLVGLLALVALLGVPAAAVAREASPVERETQEIARGLKCPVCENQSVADSPSQLAQEMRAYVQRRLEAGESRQTIVRDLVDRYGEGILLEPPREGFTLIVWWLPVLSLAVGAVVVGLTLRRATRGAGGPAAVARGAEDGGPEAAYAVPALPTLAPDEVAHYRARLADELARREREAP